MRSNGSPGCIAASWNGGFLAKACLEDQQVLRGRLVGLTGIQRPLDSTTNFVEQSGAHRRAHHSYAELVGRENVDAGTDCGFSTFARAQLTVHPSVTWAKFKPMAEGARLASEQLWA